MTSADEFKIDAECAVCGTKLSGYNLNERGGLYYCQSHYDETLPEELLANEKNNQEIEEFKKLTDTK